MSNTLLPIEKLIVSTDRWVIADDDSFVSVGKLPNGEHTFQVVTDAYLAQVHPQFPDALRALIMYTYEKYGRSSPYLREVYDTMSILVNGPISVMDLEGKHHKLSTVLKMDVDTERRQVELQGICIEVQYVHVAGDMIPFSGSHTLRYVDVSLDELLVHYPEWENTYLRVEQIGLDSITLINSLFFPKKMQNVPVSSDLTDLVFE